MLKKINTYVTNNNTEMFNSNSQIFKDKKSRKIKLSHLYPPL